MLSREEINLGGLSSAFITFFEKYDVQKKTLFHKDAQGMLSRSEFENLYAYISINNLRAVQPPAPVVQPPVAPAPDPVVQDPTTPPPVPTSPDQGSDIPDGPIADL